MAEVKTDILLESGTNEIEIMEFTIHDNLYGINVAKVTEILISAPVKSMPHVHPSVEGIFKPRDTVLTVVDLPHYLTGTSDVRGEKDIFIITNFNKLHIAFRVHTVVGISRISWTDIHRPDSTVSRGDDGVTTGIAQCGSDLVTILDFERIVAEISPETSIQISDIDQLGHRERNALPIFVAEDSILLSKMLEDALTKAGYSNLHMFPNGQELWHALVEVKKSERKIEQSVALIITDIEMPQMDGHRLTKLVKSDPALSGIPLIIFSSLITDEMRLKGKQLGANEQLAKPEIVHLVEIMDRLLDAEGAHS